LVIVETCGSDVQHPRTGGERWVVDLGVVAQAAVVRVVAGEGSDAVIARGPDESMALKSEFEEFVALAPGIVYRCVELGDAIGDADYTGRFVRPTCERAFVTSICGVRICCIDT
jgi:hypothetical protein